MLCMALNDYDTATQTKGKIMREVYIVDAKRTAVGSYLGSLTSLKAHELGASVIKSIIKTNNLPSDAIDEVILGQVLTGGQGQNPARQASINAGLDVKTPSFTVNKVCGSGLKAIALAFDSIALGHNELMIAGGQESMSTALHGALIRQNVRMGNVNFIDLMSYDGLTDAFSNVAMGITAENVSKKYNVTREDQDLFSLASQQKAAKAIKEGLFKDQIVPLEVKIKKELVQFTTDEFVRPDSSLESLAKLKPAFDQNGTVTAGNSSGINDGAAMLLLASEDALKKYNLKPIAKIVNHASAGVDPQIMGVAPAEAVKKLMTRTNFKVENLDLIEANEAFAAQAIAVNRLLNWDESKVNITGGSIAIGHPIGASGARVAVTLLHNMQRLNAKNGLASLCIGGGMGIAMRFELV